MVLASPVGELLQIRSLPTPGESYDSLTESVCQCQAAQNANEAQLIELEAYWAGVMVDCETGASERAFCLAKDLLSLQAAGKRNEAAGSALATFYLLASLEARETYLQQGANELRQSVNRVRRLKSKGLVVPSQVDADELATKLAALKDDAIELQLTRVHLNGQLKQLLGCPIEAERMFWPELAWQPDFVPPDVEGLVSEGLASRIELRSLRLAISGLNKTTLPIARAVLQASNGVLGSIAPLEGPLHQLRCAGCNAKEPTVRFRQLRLLLSESERLITAEIKAAAYKQIAQQERVQLAWQAVRDRREELQQLESRRDVDRTSVFEISRTKGRLYTAEATLVEQVIELKLAEAAVRQAQGMLAVECGYRPAVCRFCPSVEN